jgi:hypothetical protein
MSTVHHLLDFFNGAPSRIKGVNIVDRQPSKTNVEKFVRTEVIPKLDVAFPFVLEGDDFEINETGNYAYSIPTENEYELIQSGLAPMPHDVITIEASVLNPAVGSVEKRMWLLWKVDDGSLFHATPITLCCDVIVVYGATLKFFPDSNDEGFQVVEGLGKELSEGAADDLFFQLEFLCFVLLMINSKSTETVYTGEPIKLNKRRAAKGKSAIRSFTRIGFQRSSRRRTDESDFKRASPEMFWRRGHNRRVGEKTIYVRPHIVGKKKGDPVPPPQAYRVSAFPERV